ncbi:hypothetical protein [Planotetraspora sp. GP83]|uniref:hypothetical protein n=1 Tax=Planotetraspora sp. GP83 TaxID=3156264 RepID=UPI003518F0B4
MRRLALLGTQRLALLRTRRAALLHALVWALLGGRTAPSGRGLLTGDRVPVVPAFSVLIRFLGRATAAPRAG